MDPPTKPEPETMTERAATQMVRTDGLSRQDRMIRLDDVAHDLAERWGLDSTAVEWDGPLGEETGVGVSGRDGGVTLTMEVALVGGVEMLAARVSGHFRRQTGARCAEAREALRAAGIYAH